ncbi:predicted protein [Nematostella vectensis]|uniref:Platelet-derived growth factor (PDGF) family profile domain-containing protein n=1 Tax=Nematostella vectensis TaxID=45351 RepID=A7SWG1_NEMVE|nr:predicted protein [Nematostella vectensis]|eukprot:XP_001624046.1 predicted protein [Nematostella vectensis]
MEGIVVVFLVASALSVNVEAVDKELDPVFCSPRPSLVPVDHPYYNYWPFFVQLNRCGGSCSTASPRIQRCQAAQWSKISHTVFNFATGKTKVLLMTNHTSCNCSCAQTPDSCTADLEKWDPDSCSCACLNPKDKTYPCPEGFRWSQSLCRCICDRAPEVCSHEKEWNVEACQCICKEEIARICNEQQKLLNPNTCTCYQDGPVLGRREKSIEEGVNVPLNCEAVIEESTCKEDAETGEKPTEEKC